MSGPSGPRACLNPLCCILSRVSSHPGEKVGAPELPLLSRILASSSYPCCFPWISGCLKKCPSRSPKGWAHPLGWREATSEGSICVKLRYWACRLGQKGLGRFLPRERIRWEGKSRPGSGGQAQARGLPLSDPREVALCGSPALCCLWAAGGFPADRGSLCT